MRDSLYFSNFFCISAFAIVSKTNLPRTILQKCQLAFFLRKNNANTNTAKITPAAITRKYSLIPSVFALGDKFVGDGVRVGMFVETGLGLGVGFGLEV